MNVLRIGCLAFTWSRLAGQWRVRKAFREGPSWVFMLGPLSVWWRR